MYRRLGQDASSILSGFVDHIQLIYVSTQLSTIAVYDAGFNFPSHIPVLCFASDISCSVLPYRTLCGFLQQLGLDYAVSPRLSDNTVVMLP